MTINKEVLNNEEIRTSMELEAMSILRIQFFDPLIRTYFLKTNQVNYFEYEIEDILTIIGNRLFSPEITFQLIQEMKTVIFEVIDEIKETKVTAAMISESIHFRFSILQSKKEITQKKRISYFNPIRN